MSRAKRAMLRFVAIASASILLFGSSMTSAQRRTAARIPGARLSDAPPPEYDASIDEALAAYAAGQFDEALVAFRHANNIYPNARALRGIGMAAFELRDYITAGEALEQALAHQTRPLTEDQESQVRDLYTRALSFVGRFSIAPRAGASLSIDGRDADVPGWPAAAGVLWLVAGEHQLRVRDPNGRIAQLPVNVRAGDRADLDLAQARPVETAAQLTPVETPPPIEALPTRDRAASPDLTVPWVMFASGAVASIVGGILLVSGMSDADSVTNAPRGTEWAALEGAYDRAPVLSGLGIGLVAVGVVAMGAGLVWVLTSKTSEPVQVAVGPLAMQLRMYW